MGCIRRQSVSSSCALGFAISVMGFRCLLGSLVWSWGVIRVVVWSAALFACGSCGTGALVLIQSPGNGCTVPPLPSLIANGRPTPRFFASQKINLSPPLFRMPPPSCFLRDGRVRLGRSMCSVGVHTLYGRPIIGYRLPAVPHAMQSHCYGLKYGWGGCVGSPRFIYT